MLSPSWFNEVSIRTLQPSLVITLWYITATLNCMIRRCSFILPLYIFNELLKRKKKLVQRKMYQNTCRRSWSRCQTKNMKLKSTLLSWICNIYWAIQYHYHNCLYCNNWSMNLRTTGSCTSRASSLLHIAQHWVTKPHKNVKMNIFTESHNAICAVLHARIVKNYCSFKLWIRCPIWLPHPTKDIPSL